MTVTLSPLRARSSLVKGQDWGLLFEEQGRVQGTCGELKNGPKNDRRGPRAFPRALVHGKLKRDLFLTEVKVGKIVFGGSRGFSPFLPSTGLVFC